MLHCINGIDTHMYANAGNRRVEQFGERAGRYVDAGECSYTDFHATTARLGALFQFASYAAFISLYPAGDVVDCVPCANMLKTAGVTSWQRSCTR